MNQDQERNLNSYLHNIPYSNPPTVRQHVTKFVKEFQSFWIRTHVQKIQAGQSFVCYIQLAGFGIMTNIKYKLAQIFTKCVSLFHFPTPKQPLYSPYPTIPTITAIAVLVKDKYIQLQKNEANQQFIVLKFPLIQRMWTSKDKHVGALYRQLVKVINSPPLLTQIQSYKQPLRQVKPHANNNFADRFMMHVEEEVFQINDKRQKIQRLQKETDLTLARNDFLTRNLSRLKTQMKTQQRIANKNLISLRQLQEQVILGNVESLMAIDEKDKEKLRVMARHEGMREGEKRLIQFLEKVKQNKRADFSAHRDLIKNFYKEMFESQTDFLKASDT